jgi:hypothetical protein
LTYRSTCYSTGRRGLIIPGLASPARRRSVSKTAYPVHLDNIFDRANSPTFQAVIEQDEGDEMEE